MPLPMPIFDGQNPAGMHPPEIQVYGPRLGANAPAFVGAGARVREASNP